MAVLSIDVKNVDPKNKNVKKRVFYEKIKKFNTRLMLALA